MNIGQTIATKVLCDTCPAKEDCKKADIHKTCSSIRIAHGLPTYEEIKTAERR